MSNPTTATIKEFFEAESSQENNGTDLPPWDQTGQQIKAKVNNNKSHALSMPAETTTTTMFERNPFDSNQPSESKVIDERNVVVGSERSHIVQLNKNAYQSSPTQIELQAKNGKQQTLAEKNVVETSTRRKKIGSQDLRYKYQEKIRKLWRRINQKGFEEDQPSKTSKVHFQTILILSIVVGSIQ